MVASTGLKETAGSEWLPAVSEGLQLDYNPAALPGELDIVAAEVAVGGGSAVDGLTQFQVADDRAGAQVCIA